MQMSPVSEKEDIIANVEREVTVPTYNAEAANILLSLPKVNVPEWAELTFNNCYDIERNSRGQRTSNVWVEQRRNRFTASRFHELCRKKRNPVDGEFFQKYFCSKSISTLKCVSFGIQNEEKAKNFYSKATGNTVLACGLVVHPYAPHLGASPDGIIFSATDGYGVLEVKCPSGKKTSTLTDSMQTKHFCLRKNENNEPELKMNHEYYFQVQGQMLLTGLPWCDFAIYFDASEELFVQRILFDAKFCFEMYDTLTKMYNIFIDLK